MIRGTFGVSGTGIWPYSISRMIGAINLLVRIGNKTVHYLSRDYLSIFYLPLIPLGLSALVDGGAERIPLNREGKSIVVTATRSVRGSRKSDRERRLGGVRQSWILAFLVAASGALIGYWIAGFVIHSWQPGWLTVPCGLLGCGLVNRLYLAAIGKGRRYNS